MAVSGNNGYYIQHTAAGDGAASTYPVHVESITWFGFTNASHTLQVKTGGGDIVVPAFACGAAATVIGPIHIRINRRMTGIETDVLGSGTVIYHLKG